MAAEEELEKLEGEEEGDGWVEGYEDGCVDVEEEVMEDEVYEEEEAEGGSGELGRRIPKSANSSWILSSRVKSSLLQF